MVSGSREGLAASDAPRLTRLEAEKAKLKRLVADLTLDPDAGP